MRSRACSADGSASMVPMSPPAQNAPPAPPRITARTSRSRRIASTAWASSSRITMSSALRCAGRFSVIVATPSSEVQQGLIGLGDGGHGCVSGWRFRRWRRARRAWMSDRDQPRPVSSSSVCWPGAESAAPAQACATAGAPAPVAHAVGLDEAGARAVLRMVRGLFEIEHRGEAGVAAFEQRAPFVARLAGDDRQPAAQPLGAVPCRWNSGSSMPQRSSSRR